MRRFVIGDIHGCGKALRTLIESIAPTSDDELIFLGDYVDRGPDGRDCVEQLISLQQSCRTVMLRGNHEIMMMAVTIGGLDPAMWLSSGGMSTVSSYGGSLTKVPTRHLEFFQSLRPYYETPEAIFVHACYAPNRPMPQQDDSLLYWTHLTFPLPQPHASGKRVYVGHTPQTSGRVLDIGHLVCVDTFCFGGGFLTAVDLETGEVVQADRHGHLRRSRAKVWLDRYRGLRRLFHRQASAEAPSPPATAPNASAAASNASAAASNASAAASTEPATPPCS